MNVSPRLVPTSFSCLALSVASVAPVDTAIAQSASTPATASTGASDEIIVLAPSTRGQAIGSAPPVVELNESEIASYGASSVTELLGQLTAFTGSGRSRGGGGQPVILVNGRRVGDPREIWRLPPEAIQRVQVLPEETALQYGFSPDQRVVNFILKENFTATTLSAEHKQSTQGGRFEPEADFSYVRMLKDGRLSIDGEVRYESRLLESERGLVREGVGDSEANSRTLLPEGTAAEIAGLLNRAVSGDTFMTVNLRHERSDTVGFDGPNLITGRPLERDREVRNSHAGFSLDGRVAGWRWEWTNNADFNQTRTETERLINSTTSLDRALSKARNLATDASASGTLFAAPGGDARLSARTSFTSNRLNSSRDPGTGSITDVTLNRGTWLARGTLELPLSSRAGDGLPIPGELSVSLGGNIRDLSDFGQIGGYDVGVNWRPSRKVSFQMSRSVDDVAPSITQLGNPIIVNPDSTVFDFVTGQTASVALTTGGNANLLAERRSDIKFSGRWETGLIAGLAFTGDYYRNRATNPTASLPLATAAIQSAFADRFVRNADGDLIAIDRRPVNFESTRSESLRYGLTMGNGGGMGGPRAGGGGRPGAGPGAGAGGPGRPGASAPPQELRFNASAFHRIRLKDEVVIRGNLPTLDLLNGDATDENGGAPRHEVDIEGGLFKGSAGLRLIGSYRGPTRVNGLTPASNLSFSSLTTVNLRAWYNFTADSKAVKSVPFLKGSRLRIAIDNLTDTVRDVRDSNGMTPIAYQPGFIDPRGRTIEIDFRKQF